MENSRFFMHNLLGFISSISVELYEAAYSDGAGRLAQLRHITLPGIMPTITILLVLAAPSLVNAGFDQIYLFQNPLNIKVSDIIESYVLRMGLGSGMYSYSAAIGILNSILSTSLLLLVNTISKTFWRIRDLVEKGGIVHDLQTKCK